MLLNTKILSFVFTGLLLGSLAKAQTCTTVDDPVTTNGVSSILYTRNQGAVATTYETAVSLSVQSNQNINLLDLNMPTRSSSLGFKTLSNETVRGDANQLLTGSYAFELDTVLKLNSSQQDGNYEFALISGDGAKLYYKDASGAWQLLINNDGVHQAQMACATQNQLIAMDHSTELHIKVLYHEERGTNSTNTILWRKIPSGLKSDKGTGDRYCGTSGDKTFFTINNASKITATMSALQKTGWSLVASNNFFQPNERQVCTPVPAQISNVSTTVGIGSVTATWQTDLPAGSQLRITDVATGISFSTDLDFTLVTNHSVTAQGLASGTTYIVEPISVTQDGSITVGAGVQITTL